MIFLGNMKMQSKIIMFFVQIFLFLPSFSFAYHVINVENGGSIEGTVEFSGANIPKDETLNITTDLDYCGKSLPAEKYIINGDRRMKNVVIYIEDIKAGKAISVEEAVTVTNLKCAFVPHVAVGFKGNKLIMKNDDPMLHTFDIHVFLSGMELYHTSLYEQGSSVAKTFTKTGLIEITCYAHPWQRAYVYVFDHPYAVVTNENGEFVIRDIPPGTYTVKAWHEALGMVSLTDIKVESGQSSRIKLEYSWKINLY